MDCTKYSDLKSKSKQVLKKIAAVEEVVNSDGHVTTHAEPEYIVLETKKYNSITGEEESPAKSPISLKELESHKKHLTGQKDRAIAELVEVEKIITDIKAL